MKKIIPFSILFLISHFAFSQVSDLFSTQASDYNTVSKNQYTIIEGKQSSIFTSQIGAPQLPVITRSYVLPAGSIVTHVSSSTGNKTLMGSAIYLYPSQPTCFLDGQPCPDFVPPDPSIYDYTTAFPIETTTLGNDETTLGYHVVTLNICPFQYIPKDRKLYLYNQINISIQYSIGQVEYQARITERRDQLTKDFIKSTVQNPTMLISSTKTANVIVENPIATDKLHIPWKPSPYGNIPDYIIITDELLKPYFETFATYKTQRGIPTLVTTVEQIYQNYEGCDNAEKIRNYIKATYDYWGAGLFVLLGGDTAVVPGRIGIEYSSTVHNYTDMYYCDVYKPGTPNYNWNSNGDANFGFNSDIVELGLDNFIGRAPVDTEEEAQNFVTKIISYEKLAGVTEPGYVNNMLFLGAYPDYNTQPTGMYNSEGQKWHRELADQPFLASPTLKKHLLFDDFQGSIHNIYLGDEELSRQSTLDRLSNGYPGIGKFHLVSHYDHGGPYGLSTSGRMKRNGIYREDVHGLTNGSYYQIMYSTACEDGEFQKDCFAEQYVNAPSGGGVAMIGNSGSVGYFNTEQDIKLFKSIYGNLSPTSYIMGAAFASARDAYNGYIRKQLTLFGEPTMAIWSATPQTIALNVATTVTIDNAVENVLPVTINALINEATVTLYKYNTVTQSVEVYASQIIPSGSTSTEFTLNPDTEGILKVEVTAKNYLPAIADVTIYLPQAHLYITGYTMTDSNGNGAIEQGETINLSVSLTNSGNTSISSVNTLLSCNPIFATVTNGQVNYPQQINAHQTIQLSGYSFVAQVDNNVDQTFPDFLEFFLNITADGNYEHNDNFYPDIKNPKLILGSRSLTDDANDTAIKNLNIFLSNIGNVATGELTATLASTLVNSGVIEILQPTSTYGDMISFSGYNNNTPFSIKYLLPYPGPQPFTLTLTNPLGKTWVFNFDLSEALPPLITGFKFTSSANEINLKWNAITNTTRYNIYRSLQENGTYTKMNDFMVTGSSFYNDTDVSASPIWYYKISVITSTGNERPLPLIVTDSNLQGYKAWTSLDFHAGFPRMASTGSTSFCNSSATLYNVDNDPNGTKEIFFSNSNGGPGAGVIMGYYESGQEIYNIDGNETTVSGFATTNIDMYCNSAVGDLDNDGHAEVLSIGRNPGTAEGPDQGKLYVYKTIDENADNKPDKFWTDEAIDFNWKTDRNPVLYDVDGDGFLDIIVSDERQKIFVYDRNKNLLPGWPVGPIGNTDWAQGIIAVADLDHDGKGEIAFGVKSTTGEGGTGAIYIWNHDGTPFTVNPFKQFASNERADGGIVLADLDNDHNLDIITTTKSGTTGRIYAFKQDGSPLYQNWNGSISFTVADGQYKEHDMPKMAVGDLNHDGNLEIVFKSQNALFVLDKEGNNVSPFPIAIPSDDSDNSPIIADINHATDGNREIIINNNGKIYAYNFDATLCDRFPLISEDGSGFVASPSIDDIDNDGKNEIVICASNTTAHAFKTEGDSDKIDWGSFRGNPHNTGTYKEVCDNSLDLYVKDKSNDIGLEPNTITEYFWESDNIWVRNNNDNSLEHQNPEFTGSGAPNYIKVRVINRSCVASTGNEHLTVNWAKAGTNFTWFVPWNGGVTYPPTGANMGDVVGTLNIPPLQPGQEVIMTFPWQAPNPANYGSNGDEWHFCLLAKIEASNDPFNIPNPNDINTIVRNNNNVAWKNVSIVDVLPNNTVEPGGIISVGNPFEKPTTFYLEMAIADLETGKPIYEEAEVGIKMDDVLYNAWERGGKEAQKLDPTNEIKRKIVKGNHVILDNLAFYGKEVGTLRLNFNFLTKELTDKRNFVYHVMQKDVNTGKILGGETFIINKNPRVPFHADAGDDKDVDLNDAITISAADINEPAIYNWYDSDGNLIFQGKDLEIANAVAQKYKLEVISTVDGFKDYSEVEVKLNPNRFTDFAPNPAIDHVNLGYKLNEPTSAYIMIVSYYMNGGISNNYVLNTLSTETSIDLTSYPTGFYKIILVVNGEISDAKILFKQ